MKKNKIAFRSQNETFNTWGQDNEQFCWFFQNFKKVGSFKNSNFKSILNYFEMEKLRKLVFRHIKLKLLTNSSISCLSHPSVSITTWFMSVYAIACLQKNCAFLHFHRAISEKLQHIKLWKFAVFQVYQVWIKSEMVGFFHSFTWHGMIRVTRQTHALIHVQYFEDFEIFPYGKEFNPVMVPNGLHR
jgi:hypothetical protein